MRLPPPAPNLNASAERFVRTIKESCLDRMILLGESSLRRAASQFGLHYHAERNHQGLENKIIVIGTKVGVCRFSDMDITNHTQRFCRAGRLP